MGVAEKRFYRGQKPWSAEGPKSSLVSPVHTMIRRDVFPTGKLLQNFKPLVKAREKVPAFLSQ
jgi:hypothetical protein